MSFIHLHLHTEYSLLDGACRLDRLLDEAERLKMPALAMTDHGNLYGAVHFYEKAMARGLKPILGIEAYVAPNSRLGRTPKVDDSPCHLILLAENETGYRNLLKLVSTSYLEGFYYKPRIDKELLAAHSDGLIGLSACLGGVINRHVTARDLKRAGEEIDHYRSIFGHDSFFLELQYHNIPLQRDANQSLIELAKATGTPLVATNDVHYVKRENAAAHDVLLCIQTGKKSTDSDRFQFETQEFYLKSAEEMEGIFGEIPEALKNTLEVADRCALTLDLGSGFHLPAYPLPDGGDEKAYLRKLCEEGLGRRYREITPEIRRRLDHELGVITQMGFADYFLIVWDFITHAKSSGIPVGPGRGSAAGSLVAYLLGITEIDPIRWGLIFERFLNPGRKSMPDIDTDFCYVRRDEVIKYVAGKYGADRVSQIVTFGTMKARAAVRDAGRVLQLPLPLVDRVAKMITTKTIREAMRTPELRAVCREEPAVRELVETAETIEGLPRNASIHAAGVVISRDPLDTHVPLQKMKGGEIVAQYDMTSIEKIGLLKMDFLGLRNLTMIQDTLLHARRSHGKEIALDELPFDDARTAHLLADGHTVGVFQLESSGMRELLRELRPRGFADLIPLVALYRPGPLGSGMVEDFIRARHGRKSIEYLHPILEPILKETYGIILYQEQVMQIANSVAGFTLAEADDLRKAMGKKKPEVMAKFRNKFVEGARRNGIDETVARKMFDLMEYFAGYGFNKSHSAAYALLAWQTAYLKAHYPAEFMAALLTSVEGNTDKVRHCMEECHRMGIQVLPPDVNVSRIDFTVSDGVIRFGLGAVKNVGEGAIESIISVRDQAGPFSDLFDLAGRVDTRAVNRKVLESLIKCGALDAPAKVSRASLLASLDDAMEFAQRRRLDRESGQISLFALPQHPPYREQPELDEELKLGMEKEVLGFFVSGHPLQKWREVIDRHATATTTELPHLPGESQVVVGGLVTSLKRILTKRQQTMGFLELEDFQGRVEVVLFPKVFEPVAGSLKEEVVVLVRGKVDHKERPPDPSGARGGASPGEWDEEEGEGLPEVKLLADQVALAADVARGTAGGWVTSSSLKGRAAKRASPREEGGEAEPAKELHLRIAADKLARIDMGMLKELLGGSPGVTPVFLEVASSQERTVIALGDEWKVGDLGEVIRAVTHRLGGDIECRIERATTLRVPGEPVARA